MSEQEALIPKPLITPVSQPFWEGCAQGVLRIQRCSHCSRLRFYPSESCPFCAGLDCQWVPVSGFGRIASWIVIHRSVDPAWSARTPFATGVVEIDEQKGCFVPGVIEGAAPSSLKAGQRVQIAFERISDSVCLPRWRVSGSTDA
jgi:uncharacterized OB-fold protein